MPTPSNELVTLSAAHDLTQVLLKPRLSPSFPPLSSNHHKLLLELARIFTTPLPPRDSTPIPPNDDAVDDDSALSRPISQIENDDVDVVIPPSSEIVVNNKFPRKTDPPSHNNSLPRVPSPDAPTNIRASHFAPPPSPLIYTDLTTNPGISHRQAKKKTLSRVPFPVDPTKAISDPISIPLQPSVVPPSSPIPTPIVSPIILPAISLPSTHPIDPLPSSSPSGEPAIGDVGYKFLNFFHNHGKFQEGGFYQGEVIALKSA